MNNKNEMVMGFGLPIKSVNELKSALAQLTNELSFYIPPAGIKTIVDKYNQNPSVCNHVTASEIQSVNASGKLVKQYAINFLSDEQVKARIVDNGFTEDGVPKIKIIY